jgi:hypothetical protein
MTASKDRVVKRGETPLALHEAEQLIASDKVEGTAVHDPEGIRLGSVHIVMIDKLGGRVACAVLRFGGFLGIGAQYLPRPWKTLSYKRALRGDIVDLTRTQLERAPHYAADAEPSTDPGYGRSVYDDCNVPRCMWLRTCDRTRRLARPAAYPARGARRTSVVQAPSRIIASNRSPHRRCATST